MNAPLVFSDTNEESRPITQNQSWQLLILSAKSAAALDQATHNLLDFLQKNTRFDLADIAYTLQVGRRLFEHRRLALCQNREDAIRVLQEQPAARLFSTRQSLREPELVFLFPHYAACETDVNPQFYSAFRHYRETVEYCLGQLNQSQQKDIRQFFHRPSSPAKPHPLAIFISQYALAQLYSNWGVQPDRIIAHGNASMIAACLNGALSLNQALTLASEPYASDTFGEIEIPPAHTKPRVILNMGTENSLNSALNSTYKEQLTSDQNTILLASLLDEADHRHDASVFLLKTLGRLYFADINVDWNNVHETSAPRRVPLPTYPFERQRYWFTPESAQAESAVPAKDDDSLARSHQRPELNSEYLAPRNPIEQILVDISQSLLGFDRIGVADNIADLGADSMFTMLLSKKIEEAFRVTISPHHLFMQPTLSSLAEKIQEIVPATLPEQSASASPFTPQQLAEYMRVLEMIEQLPDERVEQLLSQWSD